MATSLAAGPSLDEIIERHGLTLSHLQQKCPRDVRVEVADKVDDWEMVGTYLNFGEEKLTAIFRENSTEDQRKVALFDAWSARDGEDASYFKLADVLHRRQRRDLVELLCKALIKQSREEMASRNASRIQPTCFQEPVYDLEPFIPGKPLPERIKELEELFYNLHKQLVSELKTKCVPPAEILSVLTLLPVLLKREYSIRDILRELEEQDTIDKLFYRLNDLFTFIDYGLLQHLISTLSKQDELKKAMDEYTSKLQKFMRVTTVHEMIEYWPGCEDSHTNNYSKLRAKFTADPKTYTLERLNEFRRKFCSNLKLSEFMFMLVALESTGSFYAIWAIPTKIIPEIMEAVMNIDEDFYVSEQVESLSFDDKQLYPSALSVTKTKVVKSLTDSWNMEHYQEHGSLYTRLGGYAHNVNQQNMANLMEAIRNLPDRIRGWLDGSSSVNMLITGMTGVGKSSLLNGIVGKDIALVGKSLDRGTLLMQAFSFKYHDVDFTIWDSPGLQDGFGPEKEYIADMQRNGCANSDLILYCAKMDNNRFRREDRDAIRKLTVGLGNDIWKHAVFVMTFANEVRAKPSRGQKLTPEEEQKRSCTFFKERLDEWKTKLVGAVIEAGVDAKVAESIPIVPAGYDEEQALPDRDHWLSPLWYAIILRMKERSQPALLKTNLDRIKLPEQISPEDFQKPLHEQPIVYMPAPVKYGAPPLVFTVLGALLGSIAGPAGALAGSVAGAAFGGATDSLMAYYTSGAHEEQESETASQKVE